jgi:hypothetical protein
MLTGCRMDTHGGSLRTLTPLGDVLGLVSALEEMGLLSMVGGTL